MRTSPRRTAAEASRAAIERGTAQRRAVKKAMTALHITPERFPDGIPYRTLQKIAARARQDNPGLRVGISVVRDFHRS